MYQSYFSFENYPFQNTPDPAFYFSSQTHREALAAMLYGVQERKGFILIAGDVGTGKTTLVQALKAELGNQHVVVEINSPWVAHEEILNAIRSAIGVTAVSTADTSPMSAVKERLIEFDESGRRVVLVIDEAHQLAERTLEGIRLLSNIETPTRKLIQIILLGQDELSTMLGRHSMRQIEQRIGLAVHLSRLNRQETEAYIYHRLRVARGSVALFPPETIDIIYPASQGIPRIINHLCDFCLLTAYHKSALFVDAESAREVIATLRPPTQTSAAPAPKAIPPAAAAVSTPPRAPAGHAMPPPPLNLPPSFNPPSSYGPPSGHAVPLPPFILPQAGERESREQMPTSSRWPFAVPALLFGLALGAGVWFMQQFSSSDFMKLWKGSSQQASQQARPPESAPASADSMRPRSAPESYQKSPPAPAADAADVPFPVDPTRITRVETVTVTPELDISLAASRKYGAWNDTVQDIILGVNPELSGLANLPPNTAVKLPQLSRENMIVQDNKGGVYVYYATFGNEALAKENLDTLKKIWAGTFIVTTQRKGVTVYRIYLGRHNTLTAAESMARSTWFKYLPSLN